MKRTFMTLAVLAISVLTYAQVIEVTCPCCGQKIKVEVNLTPVDSVDTIPSQTQSRDTTAVSVQCKGIKKSDGTRCTRMTRNANGYCYQHQAQAEGGTVQTAAPSTKKSTYGQCRATAVSTGNRCRKPAMSNGYCHQHGGQ